MPVGLFEKGISEFESCFSFDMSGFLSGFSHVANNSKN